MSFRLPSAIQLPLTVGVCLVMLAFISSEIISHLVTDDLPYHDSFGQGQLAGWQPIGGHWEVYEHGVRNDSDERGAKLVGGRSSWKDYSLDADVMVLGDSGDAGVIIRTSGEEYGVDSYSGYYVGLRDLNDTVAIGRADHGWMEYQVATLPGGVHPMQWYHLHVVAVGCEIAATASRREQSVSIAMIDSHCAQEGRIGLRSYSSGGIWKDVRVAHATDADLRKIENGLHVANSADSLQTEAGFNSALFDSLKNNIPSSERAVNAPIIDTNTPSLASMRYRPATTSDVVSVHGSVVLTNPVLVIQDATGGAAIKGNGKETDLKIGDAVEVTGTLNPGGFSAAFDNPRIRLLWSDEPAPALSITASQAAMGNFNDMFIEIEGDLEAPAETSGESTVLSLASGHQRFRALIPRAIQDSFLKQLKPRSVLRLRGVCVSDPAYTDNLSAFVLLIRSSEDVALLAGPPWWDMQHFLEVLLVLIALCVVGMLLYLKAERWRMEAIMNERASMARDIHDTLAQGFAGIALQLESALRQSSKEIDSDYVAMALQMARQSRKEAHVTIAALRSLHIERSLAAIIESLFKPLTAASNQQFCVVSAPSIPRLPVEIEIQILRIIQEAVANAIQHSGAEAITVGLSSTQMDLTFVVTDDGAGFDPEIVSGVSHGHFGITGMQERAATIDAQLRISSSNTGTVVSLCVPQNHQREGLMHHLVHVLKHTYFGRFPRPEQPGQKGAA